MVKVTKYDREKRHTVKEKYKREQAKIKYKTLENMCYIIKEVWKCQRFALVILFMGNVGAYVANSLFGTFTSKYVIELALGTSERKRLAIICLLLISGERISKYIWNEVADYNGYVFNFKFSHHMKRKIIRKNMITDYENNESCEKIIL